jgi:uncharacterized protein (TIGR02118 family)
VIKTISLIKRRPDLDRVAFRNHYETRHAPLALPHMKGLERYVRYHVVEDLFGEVAFDVLSAFWYRDQESIAHMMEVLGSDVGKPILEDELTFMDKPANMFFPVSEQRLRSDEEEGDEHVFVLVANPEGLSRYDSSAKLLKDDWPSLLAGIEQASFALLRDAFPMEGTELRWNALLQVRAEGYSGFESWAMAREAEGWRVTAVRTRRYETELSTGN